MPDSQRVWSGSPIATKSSSRQRPWSFPNPSARSIRWLERHFPFLPPTRFVFCGDKSILHADYLIDDMPRHFQRFAGQGVLFTAAHNAKVAAQSPGQQLAGSRRTLPSALDPLRRLRFRPSPAMGFPFTTARWYCGTLRAGLGATCLAPLRRGMAPQRPQIVRRLRRGCLMHRHNDRGRRRLARAAIAVRRARVEVDSITRIQHLHRIAVPHLQLAFQHVQELEAGMHMRPDILQSSSPAGTPHSKDPVAGPAP